MVKVVTAYNNFARAKIDHDMNGRFDLPIYQSAADLFENVFSNFKGNAIFRAGFEDMVGAFQDCVFAEFKFRDDQNYLMVFYNTKIRFLSYDVNGDFGWVESSPSVILEVTSPYSLQDCREIQMSQNADVVVIAHNDHAPQDLTRVSATSFTIGNHTFTGAAPFTTPNWPACVQFYKGRLFFANTPNETTTVWASEAGDFANYVIPSPVTDISPLKFTVSEITQPFTWLFGGDNSLIGGSAEGLVAINGGGVNTAIKSDTIEASLTSSDGSNSTIPFRKDGLIFYMGKNGRNMYYFSYDLLTESFLAQDANFVSYDITKTGLNKIRHKKDRDDLIYSNRTDGDIVSLNFKEKENIIGWNVQKSNQAVAGDVRDIAVITDNDGNPQLFQLALRNGSYYIERKADHVEFTERVQFFSYNKGAEDASVAKARDDEAYNRKVAEEFIQCNYLDNSQKTANLQEANLITYDSGAGTIVDTDGVFVVGDVGKHISYQTDTGYESGRFEITGYTDANTVDVDVLQTPTANTYSNWYLSFSTLSGLTQYNGTTVSVVTDGGYLSDFLVSGGTIDLGSEVLSAIVGYRYKGIIKSFSLGFQIQAENTQTTMKSITRFGIRTVASAGLEVGSSLYRTEPVQELTQNDINYLPPLPMDGTKYIDYTDDNDRDKYFYIVQDLPLPAIITSVMIDSHYSMTR